MNEHLSVEDGGYDYRFSHWSKRAAYLQDPRNWLTEQGLPVPAMRQTQHKPIYVSDCLRQVRGLLEDAKAYTSQLEQRLQATSVKVQSHLWVPVAFAVPAVETLKKNVEQVRALTERIAAIEMGYRELPVEQESIKVADPVHQATTRQTQKRERDAA